MQPIKGTANNYPAGQCTRYANDQYHAATGYFVPWGGDAKDWATLAIAHGWTVSSTPVVPSIMCLQAGIQLASPTFGHVGEVVSVGKGGTFTASNLNWGSHPEIPIEVLFHTGPGVSFIYATDNKNRPIGNQTPTFTQQLSDIVTGTGKISLAPSADMSDLLAAFDDTLALKNPFDVQEAKSVQTPVGDFTDPVAWIEGFGMNLVEDMIALVWRVIFLIIGSFVLIKVLSNFIDFGAVIKSAQTFAAVGA